MKFCIIKEKVQEFFQQRLSDYEIEEVFKEYATIFILFLLTVVGLVAIVPSISSGIKEGKFLYLFVILFSYSIIPFLLLKRKLPYKIRSHFLCFAMFLCGVAVMTNAPLASSARLWFLCSTVIAFLLITPTTAFVYFCLSLLALIIAGYGNLFQVVIPVESGPEIWIITLSTYILINIMVVSSAYFIYLGMVKAESDLKRSQTFTSNLELIQQIEEMDQVINKISKEYLVVLDTITEQVDLALGETQNIKLVNNLNNIRESTKEAKELSQNILTKIPEKNLYERK